MAGAVKLVSLMIEASEKRWRRCMKAFAPNTNGGKRSNASRRSGALLIQRLATLCRLQ